MGKKYHFIGCTGSFLFRDIFVEAMNNTSRVFLFLSMVSNGDTLQHNKSSQDYFKCFTGCEIFVISSCSLTISLKSLG